MGLRPGRGGTTAPAHPPAGRSATALPSFRHDQGVALEHRARRKTDGALGRHRDGAVVKRVDAQTRSKTSINELLRD